MIQNFKIQEWNTTEEQEHDPKTLINFPKRTTNMRVKMSTINDNTNRNRIKFQKVDDLKEKVLIQEQNYSERYIALHSIFERALYD